MISLHSLTQLIQHNIIFQNNNVILQNTQLSNLVDINQRIAHPDYTLYFDPNYTLPFTNSSFERCFFFGCRFFNCIFTNTKWLYSAITNCEFFNCNFSNTQFSDTTVTFCNFYSCTLSTYFPHCVVSPTYLFTDNSIFDTCTINPNDPMILSTLINTFLLSANNPELSNTTPLILIQRYLAEHPQIFAHPPADPTKTKNTLLQNLLTQYPHQGFFNWLTSRFPQYIPFINDASSNEEIRKLRC